MAIMCMSIFAQAQDQSIQDSIKVLESIFNNLETIQSTTTQGKEVAVSYSFAFNDADQIIKIQELITDKIEGREIQIKKQTDLPIAGLHPESIYVIYNEDKTKVGLHIVAADQDSVFNVNTHIIGKVDRKTAIAIFLCIVIVMA